MQQGDDWVIPSEAGGLDNILAAVSNIAGKLDRLPLDEIGANLNAHAALRLRRHDQHQELANRANCRAEPGVRAAAGHHAGLQDAAVTRAERVFGSLDRSYGNNSRYPAGAGAGDGAGGRHGTVDPAAGRFPGPAS